MVIAENLPDDSTRNSLEKIFGVIGRSETQNTHLLSDLHLTCSVCVMRCIMYTVS
jgi:hypothetical protein